MLLKDYTPPKEVPNAWYQVRKKIGDIRHTLPAGVHGPFFNDEFGDTFGTIYAFTSDGYSFAELRDYVDRVRNELLRVPDVAKIDMIGDQDEKIYIETSHRKLATLGIDPLHHLRRSCSSRTTWCRPATSRPSEDRIFVRVSGAFESAGEHPRDRHPGQRPAVPPRRYRRGLPRLRRSAAAEAALRGAGGDRARASAMRKGGDIIALGEALEAGDGAGQARPAGGHRGAPGRRPAHGGGPLRQGVHAHARGGRGHRAGGELHQPGAAHRRGGGAVASRWCWR